MEILKKLKTTKEDILNDFYMVSVSRNLSAIGRKEVHNGRAHFGIFGGGKELPQVVFAKYFQKGDWRSGYYRDQTLMLALGLLQPEEFFAMIYGDSDENVNPTSAGRIFNNHFNTININENGEIKNLMEQYNSAADISSTAGQMPRLLGLAHASKIIREHPELEKHINNNSNGVEIAFGSIGDASTSEGMFFETINAAGVMQIPMAVAVYDDGYGISVPTELQTTKSSISKAMAGFQKEKDTNGIDIYRCNGWDYPQLLETISRGIEKCRKEQVPALFHIDQLTQPLGHSTSGSHERYKSAERLQWEKDYDCLKRFREWIIDEKIATAAELDEISNKAMQQVKDAQKKEWKNYFSTFKTELKTLIEMISVNDNYSDETAEIVKKIKNISKLPAFTRRDYFSLAQRLYFVLQKEHSNNEIAQKLEDWVVSYKQRSKTIYSNYLYREGADSALKVKHVEAKYDGDAQSANGFEILNKNFDALFNKYPLLVTFGQDTGHLGGVNQGMKGMQAKYGKHRVFDTGIRETTIIGQGIGLAMRGFRPIAEIQYLDYLNYAHSTLSDDLATLQYRSKGRQAAPVIVRTRGHQLQGVWHAGSPMQMLLGSMKGIYLCVPRNMVQAAGMYNTLLQANDPAIVIEPLKAYSRRDKVPANLGEFTVQLGRPEILTEGDDVTLVTYGWNVTLALEAAKILLQHNIHVEVIDVQTLMPFDVHHDILKSIKKTNKVIFLDEDFIGGGSAYMLQKVVEDQQAFNYLDAAPKTVSSYDNRPAYGTDGEYFTKPNTEDIIQAVFNLLYETDREKYPKINFKNPL